MLSAIFQPEISSLEFQVAQLQAQIAAAQERISHLNEAEFVAGDAIKSLTEAVHKVSALAPDAIANLKIAVLNLFTGGDDASDEGKQPINPAPQPQPSLNEVEDQCAPQPNSETINPAQAPTLNCESSPFACLLEDCPSVSLQGQAVEIACSLEDKASRFVELIQVSDAVAYQRKFDGSIITVYVGGNNKGKLKNWGDWLCRTHSVTHGYQLRSGQRLNAKWELKLTPMTLAQIEKLAGCDFSKDPRSVYPDAPVRPAEPAPKAPRITQIEDVGVGDTVRSITVKYWHYSVLAVKEDGFLDCERIGVIPKIRVAMHPGSVELVSKADVVDAASTELAEHLEQQAQEAIASIEPPAYNFNPIGRRGAAANWRELQASGGLNLKAVGTGTTSMEEWRRIEAEQNQLAAVAVGDDDDF